MATFPRRGLILGLIAIVVLLAIALWRPGRSRASAPARATSGWVVQRPAKPLAFWPIGSFAPGAGSLGLEIQAVDITGGSIEGARIRLGEGRELGSTGKDGKMLIDPVAAHLPASGRLIVHADGYSRRWAWYQAGTPVVVKLFPENRIAGRVVERKNGTSLAGLTVVCGRQPTQSDVEGRFTCGDLPPGPAAIEAYGRGFHGRLPPVNLTVGTVISGVRVEVTRAAFTVRGRILAAGIPVPGASVQAGERTVSSDELGRFVLADLPPGSYRLWAHAGLWGEGPAAPVVVSDRDVEVDVEMGAQVSLLVEVVDEAGNPAAGQEVSLYQFGEHHPIHFEERTDATGRVLFEGVWPGSWSLDGPVLPTTGVDLVAPRTGPVRLVLKPRGTLRARVQAPRGVRVEGRRLCAWGDKVATGDCLELDASGTVAMALSPGRYTVELREGPPGAVPSPHTEAIVRVGATTDVTLDVPADNGVLAGQVVNVQGAPVKDALVIYRVPDEDQDFPGTPALAGGIDGVVTDAAGRFRFGGVRPDRWYFLEAFTRSGKNGRGSGKCGDQIVLRLP